MGDKTRQKTSEVRGFNQRVQRDTGQAGGDTRLPHARVTMLSAWEVA